MFSAEDKTKSEGLNILEGGSVVSILLPVALISVSRLRFNSFFLAVLLLLALIGVVELNLLDMKYDNMVSFSWDNESLLFIRG